MGIQVDIIRASIHLTSGDEIHPQGVQTFRHAGRTAHVAQAIIGGTHGLDVYFSDPSQMRAVAQWALDAAEAAERNTAAERPAAATAGDAR